MPEKNILPSYNDYVKGIRQLKPEEQLRLVEIISGSLKRSLGKKRATHSLMELEGLGFEIWKGIEGWILVSLRRDLPVPSLGACEIKELQVAVG